MGSTHQGEHAACEDYARSHRRRQTAACPRSCSRDRRQGSRGLESLLRLVHSTQSGGIESCPSREVFQRRQLSFGISRTTSTAASCRRRRRSKPRRSWLRRSSCLCTRASAEASLHLRWDQVDFLYRVLRIQRTKSGRPHALPLNATVLTTLQALYNQRIPDCPYAFPHATGRKAGEPVQDVKNAFHTALETAEIKDFTWHDLRHTFASWLIMKGASLRSVAELLGHRGLRMVMRYAHLSQNTCRLKSACWIRRLRLQRQRRPSAAKGQEKGNVPAKRDQRPAKVVEFPKDTGSEAGFERSNPPVNSRMLYHRATEDAWWTAKWNPYSSQSPIHRGTTNHNHRSHERMVRRRLAHHHRHQVISAIGPSAAHIGARPRAACHYVVTSALESAPMRPPLLLSPPPMPRAHGRAGRRHRPASSWSR